MSEPRDTLQTHIKSPAPSIGESEKDRVRVTAQVCTVAAAKVQDANARTRETTNKREHWREQPQRQI